VERAWSWLIHLSRIKFGINDTAFATASRPMTQGLCIGSPVVGGRQRNTCGTAG
jgi:hypothetical protein